MLSWPFQLNQNQRWAAAALIALTVHIAIGFAVTRWASLQPERQPGAAPLLIDLGELAGTKVPPIPPIPPQLITSLRGQEPTPQDVVITETPPIPAPTLSTLPDQNVVEINPVTDPHPPGKETATKTAAVAIPPQSANPLPGLAITPLAPQIGATSTAAINAPASWHSLLLAHLERHKHYPAIARQRRQQGVVEVQFNMDRAGKVLASAVTGSSGFVLLDRSALEMVNRAQPLPPPPAEISGKVLTIAVPVEFSFR